MRRLLRVAALVLGSAALLVLGAAGAASAWYASERGSRCAGCHEMAQFVDEAHDSAHRNLSCLDCHQENLRTRLRHIRAHFADEVSGAIRLRDVDVLQMTSSCRRCHQQEYAAWRAGPHSTTYRQIFTNSAENEKRPLMEDCFRCHGMHYDGGIRDLVREQNPPGQWRIIRAGFADQPTIPCAACHAIHSRGSPEAKPAARISVAGPVLHESLAFFDRREQMHFAAAALAIPQLYDGPKPLSMSPDQRQAICYQCHAPRPPDAGSPAALRGWGTQAGSGDDRTPMGVHEGLSCFACHNGHGENARASCKACHLRISECGLDVEKMDTTYASATSQHDIHWVRCVDCHTKGIPRTKRTLAAGGNDQMGKLRR